MADKKEYVTSLVVEADDAQVAKLRDTLQQVSNLIQGIQARGAIGGGAGGGGGGGGGGPGGGGAGGASGGGGWGPGGSGSGGPGGWGGGQGGGGQGGGGGQPPPPGGPKQYGVGLAQIATQQDEGILSTAASALPSPLPLLGVALGAAAGASVSATLSRGRQYLEFDRQRSATLGLLGTAPGIGSGSGLGFMPGDAQAQAQAMARSGLSADDLFGSALTPSAFGKYSGFERNPKTGKMERAAPKSLFEAGLLAERAGIGSGSVSDFLGMFRPGGGGAMSFGVGVPGISDPMRMENALGVAIGGALKAGLQGADVPKYLARISNSVTAMADKGVQVDPNSFSVVADRLNQMSGQRGFVGQAQTERLADTARQVSEGGGDPLSQFLFRTAAGAGQPGVTPLDVDIRLQRDPAGMGLKAFQLVKRMAGGDPRKAAQLTHALAPRFGMGAEDMYKKMMAPDTTGTDEDMLQELSRSGNTELFKRGRRGASGLMGEEAGIEASKIASGAEAAAVALRARRMVTGLTNDITPKIAKSLGKILDVVTGKRSVSDVMLDVESDYQERTFVPDDGSAPTRAPLGRPQKNRKILGHPATQIPDPKKGGASIDINIIPAPGMEGVFHFIASMNRGMDAAGVPG